MTPTDNTPDADTRALFRAGGEYVGAFCGVEMWRLPGQDGHVSRSEALAWLRSNEEPAKGGA